MTVPIDQNKVVNEVFPHPSKEASEKSACPHDRHCYATRRDPVRLTGSAASGYNGGATSGLSYESSGVNYDVLDAFKRACQREAATTTPALALHDMTEPAGIRGESAYLIETPDAFLAHVEEGLGTKNLVADAMLEQTGNRFYANI